MIVSIARNSAVALAKFCCCNILCVSLFWFCLFCNRVAVAARQNNFDIFYVDADRKNWLS